MLKELFESLQKRLRPEDVAELILSGSKDDLSAQERKVLEKAAGHSLKKSYHQFTSMMEDFHRPVAPLKQSKKADELFRTRYWLSDENCADPEKVLEKVKFLSAEIRKEFGKSDFKTDRMNGEARKKTGLEISRRRYNKLFRFLGRFETKLETYALEIRKYNAVRISKSSLATRIGWEDFSASAAAASFVAYYTARCNRRSVFTNESQDRPFDEVAKMLLGRFKRNPCAGGWNAIAGVMPDADVVEKLTDDKKLALFATWTAVLQDIAELLKSTWEKSGFRRDTMIVKRGDDSSTWNALAGAWNAARQGWISLVTVLGLTEVLEKLCFGKAMRLMAADVAYWHRASGGELEPDTKVWAELPAPWEVFQGKATCTREEVEAVCRKNGVDPEAKHWTQPKSNRKAVAWTPTPELVHGVAVSNPGLAIVLRKAGWFSGKGAKLVDVGPVEIHRDPTGAATGVDLAKEEATSEGRS